MYHLFVWSNLNFLHISQWITLPTQSCLVFYSFCANLLHSLIMWLMVPSASPHNQHLLFCCVLSILALIWLVLMMLLCPAIKRDSVSLWNFPFFSHVYYYYYYYYYYFTLCKFSQLSRTLLCILVDLSLYSLNSFLDFLFFQSRNCSKTSNHD